MINISIPSASNLLKFGAKRCIVSQGEREDRLSMTRQDVERLEQRRRVPLPKVGAITVIQNPTHISAGQFVAANAGTAEIDIGGALNRNDSADRETERPRYVWKVPVHQITDTEDDDVAARCDTLVALDADRIPAGFLSVGVCLGRAGKSWILDFDLAYLFVAKRVRGKGFGLALQVAIEEFSRDAYERIALELPKNHRLACTISSDYASKEGKRSALGVLDELMLTRELLLEELGGAVCYLREIEIDAGY
jgi:GNAT superfamily N-acetyltransferase